MANEIIMVCNSINNKNIREGELKILRKKEEQLCFEFGDSEINLKKRFYKTKEALNKDYAKALKLKEKEDAKAESKKEEVVEEVEEVSEDEVVEEETTTKKTTYTKRTNLY